MKTAPSNFTSSYLKTGTRPRVFVSIPGASKFLGTEARTLGSGSFLDSIGEGGLGTIEASVKPNGGMSVVSGVTISDLILGDRFLLGTEASIAPAMEGSVGGAGVVYAGDVVYYGARSSLTGSFADSHITIGQRPGTVKFVYRGYLQFLVPSGVSSVEDCYITLTGRQDGSATDFDIIMVEGNWHHLQIAGMFNDFDGWQSGLADYTGDRLNEEFSTAEFSAGGTHYLRLNKDGCAYVKDNAGTVVRFMLLSSRDYTGDYPTGDEWVVFDASDAAVTLRYNTAQLINQEAAIYLGYEGLASGDDTGDLLRMWTGVVDRYEVGRSNLSLDLRQNNFKKDIMIPRHVITEDDWPNCPEENIGAAYPLAFGRAFSDTGAGTHKNGIGREATYGVLSGVRGYFPCPIIDYGNGDANDPMEILVAKNAVRDTLDGWPAVWLSGLKTYGRLWANISSDIVGDYISVKAYPKAREKFGTHTAVTAQSDYIGIAVSVIPSYIYDNEDCSTPEDAYDETSTGQCIIPNVGDNVIFGFASPGSAGTVNRAEIVFDLKDNATLADQLNVLIYDMPDFRDLSGSQNDGVSEYTGGQQYFRSATALFVGGSVTAGDMLVIKTGDTNEGRYKITAVDSQTQIRIDGTLTDKTGQNFEIIEPPGTPIEIFLTVQNTGQVILNATDSLEWGLENKLIKFIYMAGYDSGSFEIKNLQVRFFISEFDKIDHVFFDLESYGYGSWIDAVGRSNTYNQNDLVENPAGVIEYITREEMGFSSSEIDTEAFDTALAALSTWKFAFNLSEREDTQEKLDDLSSQCKSRTRYDSQDRLTIDVFDEDQPFAVSGTDVPADLDMIVEADLVQSGSFKRHPLADPELVIRRSVEEVRNDFVLHYNYDPGRGEFLDVLYMTNGAGVAPDAETNITASNLDTSRAVESADAAGLLALKTLCADSYTQTGTTATWEFEAWAIRDEATATKLLQHYIERLTRPRAVIECVAMSTLFAHDEGDVVNIRATRVQDFYGTATMNYKKWLITGIQYDLDRMLTYITAEELNYDD